MSENVLAEVPGDDLAVHVVWTPVLPTDNFDEATRADRLVPDPRATFYWDGAQDLGLAYGRVIELPRGRQLAWDIYFVYDRDATWESALPEPSGWSHQLGEDERHLADGAGLLVAIRRAVSERR